ncbi:MAG: amino acid ABC transporter ATP-binding protein [Clostridiales Family XIII bacterium]|jgi:polar amino acid transport system ATP-binding protein|nr:amino acid ABC transporter ATP-binding protein [Clostridiales Family XIII bacterium]
MAIIRAVNIHKKFATVEAVRNVSLTVEQGEVIAVVGPSGSGKSTFLRCINGLETITDGEIYIDEELLEKRTHGRAHVHLSKEDRTRILLKTGMVFQRFNLFPHKTALENVMLAPVNVKNESRVAAAQKARSLLEKVGLGDKLGEYPARLSGGQQQRVAIARALAMEPEIMLFDEPTSALDPELVEDVLHVMIDLAKSGMTMLVVTHEMGFAREAADRVVFMAEGEVVEVAPPEVFFKSPESPRAQQFMRSILQQG